MGGYVGDLQQIAMYCILSRSKYYHDRVPTYLRMVHPTCRDIAGSSSQVCMSCVFLPFPILFPCLAVFLLRFFLRRENVDDNDFDELTGGQSREIIHRIVAL